jgi:hypothetical protein
MASTSLCKYCGSAVSSSEENCPNCGAPNEGYVADTERRIFLPQTIEELKEYCAERGMPLLKMRFFIGEDYRQPKAFGIYKEGSSFVVYKNKANGERAIRYRGPDEKHAVTELFMKLLEECHNRGIYPDGQIPDRSGGGTRKRVRKNNPMLAPLIVIAVCILVSAVCAVISKVNHKNDGYYSAGDGTVYYHYGDTWYYTYDQNDAGYWYEAYEFPYEDYEEYSLGDSWDSDWGVSDFKDSSTYESLTESHSSSSSDYDSWDSSDTDWDSDW